MNEGRKHASTVVRRRLPLIITGVLALVGAVLITLASWGSTSGPPQPGADAAGVIDAPAAVGAVASGSMSSSPPAASSSRTMATSAPAAGTAATSAAAAGAPAPSTPPAAAEKPAAATTMRPTRTAQKPPHPQTLLLPRSQPVSLAIPKLGVTSNLLNLGLNPDGTVEVPSLDDPDSKAGWYDRSPTPGSIGPSIILGHIDSKQFGPGVFYNLGKLMPGDTVTVTRKDGRVAVFRVDGVRSYPKDNFPTLQVYGNLDHSGLRLITCGGVFDASKGSYESNIVAYATLVSSH